MKILLIGALFSACATQVAIGAGLDKLDALSQSEFRDLAEDAAGAFSYKGVTPATPLGVLGFELGVSLSATDLQHESTWDKAGSQGLNPLLTPKLHLYKGLPAGFDLGVSLGRSVDLDANVLGAELRYALMEGGVATPAIGLRFNASTTQGTDNFKFQSVGTELLISKTLTVFTPYAGVGYVWSKTEPGVANLSTERVNTGKFLLGGNLNLGLINFAAELDSVGDVPSASVKMGWRF